MRTKELHGHIDPHATFVAIDFETANEQPDSACAVALVRVERREIVQRQTYLLRPPGQYFCFTYVHGICWDRVKDEPTFREVWANLGPMLDGAEFLAAHNAGFDRGVLHACCRTADLKPPRLPFRCSMRLARQTWGIYPTRLPDVCRYLKLPLQHHDPVADAEACARIVMEAMLVVTRTS
jgi:DNA polymerase III subunit epsilon